MEKRYYIVKNMTDIEGCSLVKTGSIAGDTYDILKTSVEDAVKPQGETCVEYQDADEVRGALGLTMFHGGIMGADILAKELEFCEFISTQLRAANSGLSIAAGDAMFSELEHTSHAVSRGLVNIAWSRFNMTNDAIITPAVKASFNALFNEFFAKYPRDLS